MSEDIKNAFNAIIGNSYCVDHREVLNSLAEAQFGLVECYINWVFDSISDEVMARENSEEFDELMGFGIITRIDIASVNYWLAELTGE